MGAHPYAYVVPYEADIEAALQKLRAREFRAGRYNPVIPFLPFPISEYSPAPGARHRSIEEALRASGADGTRSILDISAISDEPDDCCAYPLGDKELRRIFGTTRPTLKIVEESEFGEDIERGQAVYIVLYENDKPHQIYFYGFSFD